MEARRFPGLRSSDYNPGMLPCPGPPRRTAGARAPLALLLALGVMVALPARRTWAIGEVITDIRVRDNARTLEETVRSMSGISIGEVLEIDTLDRVRERLNTSGLFADVNVFWEPYRYGVRVVIIVRDKFPWAPVPTFSYSPGNVSAGLIVGHANLFGRGKRGLIGGRYSNVDSGALVVYDDPALFGSWGFFTAQGYFKEQVLPEFSNVDMPDMPLLPIRNTRLRSLGADLRVGVAWFRKVRTSVGWAIDTNDERSSLPEPTNPFAPPDLPPAMTTPKVVRGLAMANLTFDFRAREQAVMYGNALSFGLEVASPHAGSDRNIDYWKASVQYEQGIRFLRRHNFIVRAAGYLGERMPFWVENATTGANLRGFVYRQFMGDIHLRSQVEYHFPLFSIKSLDVRGVAFNDGAAIWYRKLPAATGDMYDPRPDGRQFLPPSLLRQGFDRHQDVHWSFGAGLRFFLRSVAVPLVGIDFAHGIGTGTVRMVLVVGG
jgi:outer membrane protein insertion porin family